MNERGLLDRIDDARADVDAYEARVWWLEFAIAASLVTVGLSFWAGAVTDWQNLPAALGMFAGTSFFGAVGGLCALVFTTGTDRKEYGRAKLSPRTRLRNAEREYRDHLIRNN